MSDNAQMYGVTQSEKIAEENEICRNIVSEISKFGVNQRQLIYIIYLLSLEIENQEKLRAIAGKINEVAPEIFLSPRM